jgi:signal transduction histidine kinase
MIDYLAFVYGGISESCGNAIDDGVNLAKQCLYELNIVDNKMRLPPKLLILLASPAYLDHQKAEQLLSGVYETFGQRQEDIQLIGSSVGGVFFNNHVHPEGALLVCLASRLVEVHVACGTNARQNPQDAINNLLGKLQFFPSRQTDPNPLANRLILTFMPGCNQATSDREFYPAPELHRLLYEGVRARITLFGGVSAGDPSRKANGLQFAKNQVLRDSIVAASIITGVPIGVSLNDGLVNTGKVLRATKLGLDGRTVLEFNGGPPREQLELEELGVVLAELSTAAERVVDILLPTANGSVQLLHQHKKDTYFEILRPAPWLVEIVQKGIAQAKQKVYVERPVASLLFPSTAYNLRCGRDKFNIESALAQIEIDLMQRPCIGGFFDGELGVDGTGRSRLTNGSIAYVIFGDEIRDRTPLYKGISALAEYGPKLLAGSERTRNSIDAAIDNALRIVDEAGFPGAMISLVQSNLDSKSDADRDFFIARKATGSRFPKIVEQTQRPYTGDDILAIVAREKRPCFLPSSSNDPRCNQLAIELSGTISQYVLPLKRLDDIVFGTLQVDLGDLGYLSEEEFCKTEKAKVLDSIAAVIGAGVNRIANALENDIMLRLDGALKESLSASCLNEGLDKFIKAAGEALGVEMGHLWLVKLDDALEHSANHNLMLEAGFGPCYEAHKERLHDLHAKALSLINCAFRSDNPQIINDLSSNPAWAASLDSVKHDSELFSYLVQTKSCASVAFGNERGQKLGVFSFGSTEPWFFFPFHRNVLKVLAERLGFLVEHLRDRVRLNFLLDVSPRLAERDFSNPELILQSVTEDFRSAIQAHVASLYLWDQDRQKYILRAQSGWANPEWVHAASYSTDSGWIGTEAINQEPLYIADLYKYYKEHAYDYPSERYAEYMFGQSLSDTFVTEAIGLPLRIGPSKKDKFGVLTLYRRTNRGQSSGFVTTDMQLLQQGTYNIAGLVNAVLRHRNDIWEMIEEDRHQTVYQAISSDDNNDFLEANICREVLKSFHATEVEFYRIDETGDMIRPSWIVGYRRQPHTANIEQMIDASEDHHELIKETILNRRNKPAYRVALRRYKIQEEQGLDPAALKIDGMVEQVCIPLVSDKKLLAALVIRWRLSSAKAFLADTYHSAYHLQKFGRIIGSTYLRSRINKQAAQSQLAVQTAGVYVFQHAHRLINAIQDLYRIAQTIKSTQDESKRALKIEQLETTAESYIEKLNWVFNLGELIQYPAREVLSLLKVIRECWQDVTGAEHPIDQVTFSIEEEIAIVADPKLIKEVFINLMDNAVKAMQLKKEKTSERTNLEMSAVVSEDKETVRIILKDNGVGMTRGQIDAAIRGFSSTGRKFHRIQHKGVGVLISQYLLRVQDGSLAYESKMGQGTKAVVTLPYSRIERRDHANIE